MYDLLIWRCFSTYNKVFSIIVSNYCVSLTALYFAKPINVCKLAIAFKCLPIMFCQDCYWCVKRLVGCRKYHILSALQIWWGFNTACRFLVITICFVQYIIYAGVCRSVWMWFSLYGCTVQYLLCMYVCCVCLSVLPSVTCQYCHAINAVVSWWTVVFWCMYNLNHNPVGRSQQGTKESWVGIFAIFDQLTCHVSETMQDRNIVFVEG